MRSKTKCSVKTEKRQRSETVTEADMDTREEYNW